MTIDELVTLVRQRRDEFTLAKADQERQQRQLRRADQAVRDAQQALEQARVELRQAVEGA